MGQRPPDDTAGRHTIPVIDRMMDVLGAIERSGGGLTIREITAMLGLPRTSIYRILNTLQLHEVVRRDERGGYHLGRRLLGLAARVAARADDIDVAAVCQPYLDRLAADLGEGVKLSVLDADGILVLAAAPGRREYALTVAPGQRMPIHAGAASKLLLGGAAAGGAGPVAGAAAGRLYRAHHHRAEAAARRAGADPAAGLGAGSRRERAEHPRLRGTGRRAAAGGPSRRSACRSSPAPRAERMEAIRLAAIEAARAISAALPE